MRQSHQKSRSRNRGRKTQNPLSRNFESNGPDVKIRGNASHIAEKYSSLARDAQSNGDTVMAENYLQHAEHYNRIVASAQVQNANKAEESNSLNGKGAKNNEASKPDNSGTDGEAEEKTEKVADQVDGDTASAEGEKPAKRRKKREETEKESKADSQEGADEAMSSGEESGENISEDAASLPQSITGGIAAENS